MASAPVLGTGGQRFKSFIADHLTSCSNRVIDSNMRNKEQQKIKQHESYLRNKEKVRLRSEKRKLKARTIVSLMKESKPCKDCGKWYPYYVMHFDHLRDKEFNISEWAQNSLNLDKLKQEIDKCDLVCANCHSIRSYYRKFHQELGK